MSTKKAPKIVDRRPLIDCTLSKGLPDSYKQNRLRNLLKAAVIKATEMWRNRLAEISFKIKDLVCQIKLGFRKEYRHHVFGYVFVLKIKNCSITCIIDRQVMEEPEIISQIKWENSVESIALKDLRELWHEHMQYRSTLC